VSVFDARPHPDPLPRGEGEAARVILNFARHNCCRRPSIVQRKTRTTTRVIHVINNRRMILPLLGERAGLRVDTTTNFSGSRFTFHVSRH
jgi:hypothetical protein